MSERRRRADAWNDGNYLIRIKLTLPCAWKVRPNRVVVVLQGTSELELTWKEVLKKYSKEHLYATLKQHIGIGNNQQEFWVTDNRHGRRKYSWTLDTPVQQFIDSFSKIFKEYKATIVNSRKLHPRANPPQPPKRLPPTVGGTSPRPSTSAAAYNLNLRENAIAVQPIANNGGGIEGAGLVQMIMPLSLEYKDPLAMILPSNMAYGFAETGPNEELHGSIADESLDDIRMEADSTANQSSQDSMSDLNRQGVDTSQALKSEFVSNVARKVDSGVILRVQHELKEIKKSGKWLKATRRLPHASILLAELFNV